MLNKNIQTNQNIEQIMGKIVYNATTNSVFREQLVNNYENAINQLYFDLFANSKTQLTQQVKQFVESQAKQGILQVADPDLVPEGYWL